MLKNKEIYRELKPSKELEGFVHSYWMYHNSLNKDKELTLFPDSFFKFFCIVKNNTIIKYQLTGLWTSRTKYIVPADSFVYGCRLKILSPEYLLDQKMANLVDSLKELHFSFLNINNADASSFDSIVKHWNYELIRMKKDIPINKKKRDLSHLIYLKKGNISIAEVAKKTNWSSRQINRYFNNYLGISLKEYLNIQKCYDAILKLKTSNGYFPNAEYFDQSHFIREVKKHTNETPRALSQQQKDRFIQLFYVKDI